MQVNPGELPDGFCPASEQSRLNAYAQSLAITFPLGFGNFSQGNNAPPVDMQGFPWFRYNADGSPDRWYVYFNGAWVSPNTVAALDVAALRFHPGPYASIATYDGGDTNTPGSASGPMWSVIGQTTGGATDYGTMGGRIPVGVSAVFGEGANGLPPNASATPSTTLGMVTLAPANIPAHNHTLNGRQTLFAGGSNGSGNTMPFAGQPPVAGLVAGGNSTGSDANGNANPPTSFYGFPWMAGYWIQRTSRIFYRV